jgi:hypothetical protein
MRFRRLGFVALFFALGLSDLLAAAMDSNSRSRFSFLFRLYSSRISGFLITI